jgi:protein-S-isoprenylcysteine O-methyltransferase Ste14
MYATLFLCAMSTCLISANYAVMATTVAVASIMLMRIKKEEAMLAARFGSEYDWWRQRTGALVPRLRLLQ